MAQIACSRKFTRMSAANLGDFAGEVIKGLTDHQDFFKNCEPTVSVLTALTNAYQEAVIKAANRDRVEIAEKDRARTALLDGLEEEAAYVDMACKGDVAKLLASGFTPVSTNRTPVALSQVQVRDVQNAQSGELKVRVRAQRTAKAYEGRIKATGSEFGPSVTFASSRDILFKGLSAGVKYVLQVCAIGGATGRSDWSDPVEHMAM